MSDRSEDLQSDGSSHSEGLQLNQRDTSVLHLIEEESLRSFSFDGLKRTLGVHSETLSRIMDRLEEQDLVEKTPEGYSVTQKGEEILTLHPLNTVNQSVPLLRTLLPPDSTVRQITSGLKGRWFGDLRWLGYSLNEAGITLKWVTEDGGIKIDAIFLDGELNIEAKLREGKGLSNAIRASHQLMSYIAKYYSKLARTSRIAELKSFEQYIMPT